VIFRYEFIGQGAVVSAKAGYIYIDVGNSLEPGIIDHHQPGAPASCAAGLVLQYPEYVFRQVDREKNELTIVVHHQPDMDAISGAWFARQIAAETPVQPNWKHWSHYVCDVDRGKTRLDPEHPVTLYSLFMMRQYLVRRQCRERDQLDLQLLEHGFDFVTTVLAALGSGHTCADTDWLESMDEFRREREMVLEDIARYKKDIARAELVTISLPRKDNDGREQVPGLWIVQPESILFKSWARGDTRAGSPEGFIFTGVQLNESRHILSVAPESSVYLKGLGDLLEEQETEKRKKLGVERKGPIRPGYSSPDPWYDGRSALHNYTIIDAPRGGAILSPLEIRRIVEQFVR